MRVKQLGGYEIHEMIGAGGAAEVYKAWDASVQRLVAIKILLPRYSQDKEFQLRFEQEARSIGLLEHSHIMPIYAYGEENDILYLVLRYMPNGSVADLIKQLGPIPLPDVKRLLHDIAAALDYAHAQGIVHRDLKSENLLLDANHDVYVADFGLAKLLKAEEALTGEFVLGTPWFMSPEQAYGEEVTPLSDQYALGVVTYHMVTGRLPFESDNPLKVLQMHVRKNPPPPRASRADLPAAVEEVMLRALAKDPTDRFQTCAAFADAFARALSPKLTIKERFEGEIGERIDAALNRLPLRHQPDDEDEQAVE